MNVELLQTKHHVNKVGDLTDTSVDLWKTLRVWSEAAKANPAMPGRTRLILITTGQAPALSAASYLRADGERDVDKAEALLVAAAQKSENQTLKEAFLAFQNLAPEMRTLLLSAVEILDQAPVITELEAAIEDRLKWPPSQWATQSEERPDGRIQTQRLDGAKGTLGRDPSARGR